MLSKLGRYPFEKGRSGHEKYAKLDTWCQSSWKRSTPRMYSPNQKGSNRVFRIFEYLQKKILISEVDKPVSDIYLI